MRRCVVRDIDIGIVARKPIGLEELNEVASELEKALRVSVDVVPLDEAPPLLRFKALSEGIRAINRNPFVPRWSFPSFQGFSGSHLETSTSPTGL